jgi:hypothetical protein
MIAITVSLLFIAGSVIYSRNAIVGSYVNTNYESSSVGPSIPDTLILFSDGTVESKFYSKAEYCLKSLFFTNQVEIIYDDGSSRMTANVEGLYYGNPKIVIFRDLNHHYRKIE